VTPNSPAQQASLEPGDILTSINEKLVKDARDTQNYIGLLPVSKAIEFEVFRNSKRLKLKTKVASRIEHEISPLAVNARLEGVTAEDLEKENHAVGDWQV